MGKEYEIKLECDKEGHCELNFQEKKDCEWRKNTGIGTQGPYSEIEHSCRLSKPLDVLTKW